MIEEVKGAMETIIEYGNEDSSMPYRKITDHCSRHDIDHNGQHDRQECARYLD